MSVEAITWALRQPVTHSSAKFVLVVLANCANAEHAHAWPSVAYVSSATGQDRKTVIANLQRLQQWGLIEDTGKRIGDTKQIVVYKLICGPDLFHQIEEKRNSYKNGTVNSGTDNDRGKESQNSRKESRFSRKESQKRDTEPSITQKNQKSIGQRDAFAEFWSVYPKRVKRKPTMEKWKAKGLDAHAERIIADVRNRLANDGRWREGFIPDPLTYITQERWEDELQSPAGQPITPTPPAPERDWRKPSETKLDNEIAFIRQSFRTGAYGTGEAAAEERDLRIGEARARHETTSKPEPA